MGPGQVRVTENGGDVGKQVTKDMCLVEKEGQGREALCVSGRVRGCGREAGVR